MSKKSFLSLVLLCALFPALGWLSPSVADAEVRRVIVAAERVDPTIMLAELEAALQAEGYQVTKYTDAAEDATSDSGTWKLRRLEYSCYHNFSGSSISFWIGVPTEDSPGFEEVRNFLQRQYGYTYGTVHELKGDGVLIWSEYSNSGGTPGWDALTDWRAEYNEEG